MDIFVYKRPLSDTGGQLVQSCMQRAGALAKAGGASFFILEDDAREEIALPQRAAERIVRYLKEAEVAEAFLIFPSDLLSNDIAAATAARLSCPLVTDCTQISWEDGFIFSRPSDRGSELIEYEVNDTPIRIATLKPKKGGDVFDGGAPVADQTIVLPEEVEEEPGIQLLSVSEEAAETADPLRMQSIVAGGSGISPQEDFALLHQLAERLGGGVCVSRPVVDKGWYDRDVQIGLSGKTVYPKLYIAVGISGAFQHTVGMNQSEHVAAINLDRNAAMFDAADIGVVADYKVFLPELLKRL